MIFDNDRFSKMIRHLRRRIKWSQSFAAMQCGVSSALWISLENRRIKSPTIKTIMKIAYEFGMSIDELVGWKVPKHKPKPAEALPSFFLTNDFNSMK